MGFKLKGLTRSINLRVCSDYFLKVNISLSIAHVLIMRNITIQEA